MHATKTVYRSLRDWLVPTKEMESKMKLCEEEEGRDEAPLWSLSDVGELENLTPPKNMSTPIAQERINPKRGKYIQRAERDKRRAEEEKRNGEEEQKSVIEDNREGCKGDGKVG